jgi:hypothetical protein
MLSLIQLLFLLMGFLFSVSAVASAVFVTSDFAAQLFMHLLAAIYYVGFAIVQAIKESGRR